MTKKSVLQKARAAYQPKLPTALWGAVKAVKGAATESVADQEEIKKLLQCVLATRLRLKISTITEILKNKEK